MPQALKKGLGRGLGALISGAEISLDEYRESETKNGVLMVDINRIEPNRVQPRKYFDERALEELAESIKNFGVLQPIIVTDENGYYNIIAGERRWRAARMAKLAEVPVIVKEYSESDALHIALIENLQRQDLNPIEEAFCYKKLVDDYFYTHEEVAKKIGKERSNVTYIIGLLNLEPSVRELIAEGKLTAFHGRLLGRLDPGKQLMCAERIIERDLNSRDTEQMIKNMLRAGEDGTVKDTRPQQLASLRKLEDELKTALGTKVSIRDGKKKGAIEIEYYSMDELDRITLLLKRASAKI
ncbi:MAG: ParB/RepB/Spo0J family partition protein [Clostridiales bacterium]|jgi:ParB family chromosome partitioning protein|nr:ParB/RepB/Spo0J family partition protein [Clostridiales bacterium]